MNPRSFFGHPAGLSTLFFTEMWERLSYYGMRAILVLFLAAATRNGGLGLDDTTATALYGLYAAGVYLTGLPGGWIADRLIGAQRAVLWGGIIIACGHLLLGLSLAHAVQPRLFYLGLFVIVIGTGLLKPNVSSLVAQLYPEGGARMDSGYTLYYFGINIGGTLGPIVVGWLAARYGWAAGFMAAAVGMALGVVQFAYGRRRLQGAGAHAGVNRVNGATGGAPAHAARWMGGLAIVLLIVTVLFWTGTLPLDVKTLQVWTMRLILAVSVLYFVYLLGWAGLSAVERRRMLLVVLLFVTSVVFWAGYEQAGSSLNLFAERFTDRHWAGFEIPTGSLQALDSVFVLALAPVFSALWMMLARRRSEWSTPLKFALGLAGVGTGFLVMAQSTKSLTHGHLVGMGWLTLTYLLHTIGELFLSPVGMSAFSQLMPARFAGQALGIWFVTLSLGNLLGGRIAGAFDLQNVSLLGGQFLYMALAILLVAVLLIAMIPIARRWSGN